MSSNSILNIKPSDSANFIGVPVARGKSAYEQALQGGFKGDGTTTLPTEEQFNKIMANLVSVKDGDGTPYQLVVTGEEPASDTDSNVITIVLE